MRRLNEQKEKLDEHQGTEAEVIKREEQIAKKGEEIRENEAKLEQVKDQIRNQDRVEEQLRLFESYYGLRVEIESLRSEVSRLTQSLLKYQSVPQAKQQKLSEKQEVIESLSECRGILQTLSNSS